MRDQQKWQLPGHLHVKGVDLGDHDVAAAERRTAHEHRRAFGGNHLELRRVGVRVAQVDLGELDRYAGLPRQVERAGDASIVGPHAEQPGHERKVGSVPGPGRCKGAVEQDADARGLLAEDLAGKRPESAGAGRVAGGGPNHHRTHNVENASLACHSLIVASRIFALYERAAARV